MAVCVWLCVAVCVWLCVCVCVCVSLMQAAIDICDEHPANHYCIVFLSDGLPGDLHMNSARDESRLYDVMDRLKDR